MKTIQRVRKSYWRGRTRDTELFTSSLKQQIPNVIKVHLSANRVIACDVELISFNKKIARDFNYGDLKGGE